MLVGLLFTQFVQSVSIQEEAEEDTFAQHVNLALRRTAHTLLREQGDSTSRIAPVQQLGANTYAIRLEKSFAYDQIPTVLQESLQGHNIDTPYTVAVLDCAKEEVQLGYSYFDLNTPEGVACSGRVQPEGCHTLRVTFESPLAAASSDLWWAGALGFLLAGLGGLVWYRTAASKVSQPTASGLAEGEKERLQFGQTLFHPTDQSINVAGFSQTLTYRETKLLRLFAIHPNQLLEREYILKAVWEDEGIIVGRSVDVFVSRLRKLLQNDPTLRIASVHGVGYRLEVRAEAD